jgi:hypothetical protein
VLAAIAATAVLPQCAGKTTPQTTTSPSQTTTTAPAASPSPPAPETAVVHQVTAEELGASWRPECPVTPAQLRRVELSYTGLDGQQHRGELIVHQDVVPEVIAIFAQLNQQKYPIEKMRSVTNYPGAEDELSMEDNNTSAFNCRPLPGSAAWSWHAYGRAIDVNPLINPYVDSSGYFEPHTAAAYLDRNRSDPGLLHPGDPAVRVFTDRGWTWGGDWQNPIDYQHFELATGP